MHTEARKLQLIEAILRIKSSAVLEAIETLMANEHSLHTDRKTKTAFSDLLGVLTYEEAEAMKSTIKENFEQINPDDWK